MKRWLIAEAVLVAAIIVVGWLIKIQLTPVTQAKETDNFEIYIQTEEGLVPYSRVKIIKLKKENFAQPEFPALVSFPYRLDIQQRIREIEPELGDTLILLANCESTLNPNAVGDGGNSFGLFQICLKWHPDVTKQQAQDISFATKWTAQKIKQGQGYLWSCWEKI